MCLEVGGISHIEQRKGATSCREGICVATRTNRVPLCVGRRYVAPRTKRVPLLGVERKKGRT